RHQLPFVVGLLCYRAAHNHLCRGIHCRLSVEALHETFGRPVLHDPRIRIGEVPLGLRLRLGLLRVGHLRRAPPRFSSPAPPLVSPALSVSLRPPLSPPPRALGLLAPAPPWPPRFSLNGCRAAPTLLVAHRRASPCRTWHPPRHRSAPLPPAVSPLPPGAPFLSRSSVRSSSPYACWHWPATWSRRSLRAPVSPTPPFRTTAMPAGTIP